LLEFINLNNVCLSDNYEYYPYLCDNCHILHTKFRYTLISDNKVFYPKYKCFYCNNFLRRKKKNENYKIKCENCSNEEFKKELETLHMFLWD